jgi:prefoldin alpha subunit
MNEQMQELGTRMKFLEEQMQKLEQQLQELANVKETVEEISNVEAGKDLLIPLGAGVFIRAKVKETDKVVMNVGSAVVVEKDIKDASQLVSHQLESLEEVREKMTAELANIKQTMQFMQVEQN